MNRIPSFPGRQRGAVLYIALIMLVLLTLIGIIGMQVAGMQERMSANYRTTNLAFQGAEAVARETEQKIADALFLGGGVYAADHIACTDGYVPSVWAGNVTATQAEVTRRLDKCFPGGSSRKVGGPPDSEDTGNVYQVTALSESPGGNSEAVVDTVYIP